VLMLNVLSIVGCNGGKTAETTQPTAPQTVAPTAAHNEAQHKGADRATQQAELKKLINKIKVAGLEFKIADVKPGSVQKLSQSTSHNMLIWNSAAQRLYPSIEAAKADFPVMAIRPGSDAEQSFERNFTEYRDDVLFIRLLSNIYGLTQARGGDQACDKAQLPWLRRCENRRTVGSSLGSCC
jgi:hypothetical protein